MATDWPKTGTYALPYLVQQDQFSFNPGSGTTRDGVDAGYPIVRRRFTSTVDTYSISLIMTYTELINFYDFFRNSPGHSILPGILYGSVAVNFPEPLWYPGTGQTEADRPNALFRWVTDKGTKPYSVSPDGNSSSFAVSFELEKLP